MIGGNNGYERALALISIGRRGDRNTFLRLAMATVDDGLGPETLFALAGIADSLLISLGERTDVAPERLLHAVALALMDSPDN
jgi:hypothetical protein